MEHLINHDALVNLPPAPSNAVTAISAHHAKLFSDEQAAFDKIEKFFGVGPNSKYFNSPENIAKYDARQTEQYQADYAAWVLASAKVGRAFKGFHPKGK